MINNTKMIMSEMMEKQILELLADSGKSAADMTHALKVLGKGDMQKGISMIGDFFSDEIASSLTKGLHKGRFQGVLIGLGIAGAVGGAIAYKVHYDALQNKHLEDGQHIIKVLSEVNNSSESLTNDSQINSEENCHPM